ncbi:hypothetical protein [Thermoactinomyces mirandus]|nr:hypothetical protein [Thermoactinomyces mirandus]
MFCKHLAKKGIAVIEDEPLPGANRFYVHDLFGNRLEIVEWIDEQG